MMDADDPMHALYPEYQSLSPQASTDEKSLHRNWQQNKESLQRRLSIRRPVDDLVNNGIMMSPLKTPPCYAEKMRQLERAKTTDILKQKIQHRPDAQSLVDRHILPEWPPDEIGASPQVFEQQQQLRRTELMSSLNAKLAQRPGSLEMAEKGLLPLAPPMQTMLREGSISYPRVDDAVSDIEEELEEDAFVVLTRPVIAPPPPPAPPQIEAIPAPRRVRQPGKVRKSAGPSTSKVGNFVFHTYCPPAKEPEPEEPVLMANRARQIQQEEYLRLQESEVKQNVLMQQLVQDIRSRHDSRPSVLQAPAAAPFPGLAALNVQQLKEECRRYKVPRSGNKLNLIRHLEPFQQDILKRYVMSAQTSPTVSPATGHMPLPVSKADEQSMRHSSSAPQLSVTDLATTTASQWQQQPTAVIVLNQAGQMTLQPATVLLTQPSVVQQPNTSQVPPPPPPPASLPQNTPAVVLSDSAEEEELVKKVEQLERLIVQNIQESDQFKAAHNGAKAEHLERQRQVLMADYASTKRTAKVFLSERSQDARVQLIKLCEAEESLKASGDLRRLEATEREREVVLQKYNRLHDALNKIMANATPNTSVSSDARVRSLTDSVMCAPVPQPINRSVTVSGGEHAVISNGTAEVKRLPSVEFQLLNEVLNEDHGSKAAPVVANGDPQIADVSYWLNAAHGSVVNGPAMSPMQMDLDSRCSTPQRPAPPTDLDAPGQFNFDFLCNPNMDVAFPSLGAHPSAASMTEQILTPNTQNALYQLIQPDVVGMETDNDSVFVP